MKNDLEDTQVERFDFYKDPNPNEIKLAYNPVSNLILKLESILTEYPEYTILKEIQIICLRVLNQSLF